MAGCKRIGSDNLQPWGYGLACAKRCSGWVVVFHPVAFWHRDRPGQSRARLERRGMHAMPPSARTNHDEETAHGFTFAFPLHPPLLCFGIYLHFLSLWIASAWGAPIIPISCTVEKVIPFTGPSQTFPFFSLLDRVVKYTGGVSWRLSVSAACCCLILSISLHLDL